MNRSTYVTAHGATARCSSDMGSAFPAPASPPPCMAEWLESRRRKPRWWQRLIGGRA